MTNPPEKSILDDSPIAPSEERFRALVTATADIVYSMSADWQTMRQLDGRGFLQDALEPITDWIQKYIPPDDEQKVREAIADAIRNKKIFQLEHRVVQADGTTGWTLSRAVPILNDNGEIIER